MEETCAQNEGSHDGIDRTSLGKHFDLRRYHMPRYGFVAGGPDMVHERLGGQFLKKEPNHVCVE
jgi:hypothetical protein